jgi:hypothetical protein
MGDHGDSEEEEEIEVNMSQMPTNKSLHAVRPGSLYEPRGSTPRPSWRWRADALCVSESRVKGRPALPAAIAPYAPTTSAREGSEIGRYGGSRMAHVLPRRRYAAKTRCCGVA